jgi:hypothetical protein
MSTPGTQALYNGDGLQAKVVPLPNGTFVVNLYCYVWDDDLSNGWPCVANRPFNKRQDAERCAIDWCKLP